MTPAPKALSPFRDFLRTESAGGSFLLAATVSALAWANSPFKDSYHSFWATELSIDIGTFNFSLDLQHWINDGLMGLFFFLVGLEIKREITSGYLSNRRTLSLPIFAALGGMAVPAVLYLLIGGGTDPRGWGVPIATDIALAIGLITALRGRVNQNSRALLLGLAVVDDIGAILVIAVFYSSGLIPIWLLIACVSLLVTLTMKRLNVQLITPYLISGLVLWYSLYEAGVHPTLAGVIMGILTPNVPKISTDYFDAEELQTNPAKERNSTVSLIEWFEHLLHPWSSFLVIPLFALANAGIEISIDSIRQASTSAIAWGIFVGLVVGKPVGVVVASLIAKKSGMADLPAGSNLRTVFGIGQAAGIGFTVALFISDLAFVSIESQEVAKLSILVASTISAIVSFMVLKTSSYERNRN